MPTYEYRCEKCERTVEVVQGFTDAPLTVCESCGGALRKVYAPVGIVFKGSGFYKTDSRSTSRRSSAGSKESNGDASSKEASSGSSSDAGSGSSDGAASTKAPSTATEGAKPKAKESTPAAKAD